MSNQENKFSKKMNEHFQEAFADFIEMFITYASGSVKSLPDEVDYIKTVVETSDDGGTYLLTLQHVSGPKLKYVKLADEVLTK